MMKNWKDLLRNIYLKSTGSEDEFNDENEAVLNILECIEKQIESRFIIEEPINIGGAGLIFRVKDTNLEVINILKVSRPIKGREEIFNKILASEISRLKESTHQNIISIYYTGEVEIQRKKYPYYIMEYVKDAVDGIDYINQVKPTYIELLDILKQWVQGLLFLHSNGTIHGDVKLENVLISKQNHIAKVSDLGSARLIDPSMETLTTMTFTIDYAHPELFERVKERRISDNNRVRLPISRADLKKEFDMYSLGKNILRIIGVKDYSDNKFINDYQRNYFVLMGARLLDGYNEITETIMNIPNYGMKLIKYKNLEEVLLDLKKATGEYSINEVIPELNRYSRKTIQISQNEPHTFTNRISRLLNTRIFNRLASISQLGLMVEVYPTANHTRYEHVIGTMFNVAKYCDALWHDPINPFFKQIVTEKEINTILIAALFHDVGQYALAHDLEEIDKKLFSHLNNNLKILENKSIKKEIDSILLEDWGISTDDIIEVLSTEVQRENDNVRNRLLKSIIDGPIDADKMDYLIRDSNNLNIPYGKAIDLPRIIRCLTIVFDKTATGFNAVLGIHEKGKIAAEGIAFARYAMFGTVYWHHTVRSLKSMLQRAVWEALPLDPDRRKQEYKNFQEAIFNEINYQLGIDKQNLLFKNTQNILENIGNFADSDFSMLSFLFSKTTGKGKELIRMICERKLYKRLFVISPSKMTEIWDQLVEVRKSNDWSVWLRLQNNFQSALIIQLERIDDKKRKLTALSKENTSKIFELHKLGVPLFLIDIPVDRPGSSYPLRYLHEVRFANSIQYNYEEMIQPEDSVIWKSITADFLRSVGKARIFCHPDIVYTASAFYMKDMIETAIRDSLRNLQD